MKTATTGIKGKKFISLFTALIVTIVSVIVILPPVRASAEANGIVFPLPTDRAYKVSVFDYYSDGTPHESYITNCITKKPAYVIDIPAANNTPVYANASGYIKESDWKNLSGNYIVIEHEVGGEKYYSYFGHLNTLSPYKKGAYVTAGTEIGRVGHSGLAYGDHVHHESDLIDVYCYYKHVLNVNISVSQNSGASYSNPHKDHVTIGNNGQLFINDGCYRIYASNKNYSLDIYHGDRANLENGQNAQIYSNNNGGAQAFYFEKTSDGTSYVITHILSGYVLDENVLNSNVTLWQRHGGDNQRWLLYFDRKNGAINIVNKKTGRFLDISGDIYENYRNVGTWNGNGTKAQAWSILPEQYGIIKNTSGTLVVHNAKNYLNSSAIDEISENSLTTIIMKEGSFAYIKYGDYGKEGWVCAKYVKDVI